MKPHQILILIKKKNFLEIQIIIKLEFLKLKIIIFLMKKNYLILMMKP